jgi:hypothetical protein
MAELDDADELLTVLTVEQQLADALTAVVMAYTRVTDRARIVCPRETSWMTPCIARDGHVALADDDLCAGCGVTPRAALEELRARSS